jgi:hypothetical protein
MSRPRIIALTALCAILLPATVQANAGNVHVTRHWHLHQPIYWPEWNSNGNQTQRYQYGWDSLQIKINNGNRYAGSAVRHPENNLVQGDPEGQFDAVFSPDDRIKAYQAGPKESLSRITDLPYAGYSMSYSGALIENVNSFGRNNAYGYSSNWNQNFIDMRNWRNQSGQRRHDLLGFTYHHSFGPLIPKSVLRKELQIFKEIYWKTWDGQPDKSDHSKGFWPSEGAFSRHMIDVLVDENYEWTIVANSHLSRTAQNFDAVAGLGNTTSNIDPPNRADRLGPDVPANQWWSGSLDGRGAWQAAPFAYQAHKVQYVNPSNGVVKRMTVVPMDDVISYQLGYGSTGTGTIATEIEPFATDSSRPVIVLVSTDGENAWGGGYDSWQNATPGFIREAHGRGYESTVIQKFLDDHPVPESAVVHIEDGSWFNAANDWGHPQFINWLYPPVSTDPNKVNNLATRYDFETPGFAEDFRNWAVLMAGANWMETAEQIYKQLNGADSVQAWRIQEPYQVNGTFNNPNAVERGWHIFLAGFDSGFMYYGDSLDDEVKQSLASNRAISQVKSLVESNLSRDQTAPTIFKPQRFPWNPGGRGWGPLTLYRQVGFNGANPWPSDFYIWTHVFDVSDVQSVTLRVRVDNDGANTLANNQNETFAGGSDVGTWIEIPMQKRVLPRANPTTNTRLNFFIQPDYMADYYFAKITHQNVRNFRGKLLDYYVVAVDGRGNVSNSDIQHVFVEDDGVTPPEDVAPSQVAGLTVSALSPTSVRLAWSEATGASAYKVFRGDSLIATVTTLSFDDMELAAQLSYSYTIAASNSAGDALPSAATSIQAVDVNPFSLFVLQPSGPASVGSEVSNYTFIGQMGVGLTNGVTWSNLLTGQSGSFSYSRDWSASVPVGAGTNNIVFSSAYIVSGNQTNAADSPANSVYTAGLSSGANGGNGFGAWELSSSGTAGHFVAQNQANLNTGIGKGFGLYANSGGVAVARRSFNEPLKVGDKLSIRIDNNWILPGNSVGFALADSANVNRVSFSFVGGEDFYRVTDAGGSRPTDLGYTDNGLDLTFELTASNAYSLRSGSSMVTSGTFAAGGAVSRLIASNSSAGPDDPYNFYLGAMSITAPVNTSGVVSIDAPLVTRVTDNSTTDGVPNTWWNIYFPDSVDWVAGTDHDKDGFTNSEEYALGTDPTSNASAFRIISVHRSSGSSTVTWISVAGKKYRLQAKANLSDANWIDVAAEVTADGGSSIATHEASTVQFYRVRLVP